MAFSCWVTKKDVVGRCRVKSCMWNSAVLNKGCMAFPEPPDVETMSDATLAKHKGISVVEFQRGRAHAAQRIKNVMIVNEFLEWCSNRDPPWKENYDNVNVVSMIGRLRSTHWLYKIPELNWTAARIAYSVNQSLVGEFLRHRNNTHVKWMEVLELDSKELNLVVNIFKLKETGNDCD